MPLWLPCQFLCCQVSHFLLFVRAGGCQARWNASEVIFGGHAPAPRRAIPERERCPGRGTRADPTAQGGRGAGWSRGKGTAREHLAPRCCPARRRAQTCVDLGRGGGPASVPGSPRLTSVQCPDSWHGCPAPSSDAGLEVRLSAGSGMCSQDQ